MSFLPELPLVSSAAFKWSGIELEEYESECAVLPAGPIEKHVLTYHSRWGGWTELQIGGKFVKHWIAEGTFCVVPAGPMQESRWFSKRRLTLIALDPEGPEGAERRGGCQLQPRIGVADAQVAHLAAALTAEAGEGNPSGRLYAESLAQALRIRLNTAHGRPAAHKRRFAGGLTGWRLQRVVGRMLDDLERPPALAELAQLAGLHPDHLARAFRQETGLPPHRYLMRARIRAATELLTGSETPLADIAAQLGFADQSHFQNVFRREMGSTPAQFRADERRSVFVPVSFNSRRKSTVFRAASFSNLEGKELGI